MEPLFYFSYIYDYAKKCNSHKKEENDKENYRAIDIQTNLNKMYPIKKNVPHLKLNLS